jgi:hypothetical protein
MELLGVDKWIVPEAETPPIIRRPNRDYLEALQRDRLNRIAAELARRKIEALNLYEPLPEQLLFHKSKAQERLLRGSNRGGKTLPAAVDLARAVMGQDRQAPKRDGRAFLVGKDGRHVGQVLYRKLFRAGAFKIIRDKRTHKWRAYRPFSLSDLERGHLAKPAPPLIPPRMIREIGWENKKENWPSVIRLINGWELNFFSSLGKPPQGSDIDRVWFDEEIIDPDWYPEMSARLVDRHGRLVWSATPQAGTEQLYQLHERADVEKENDITPRTIEEFVVLLEDNKFIDEKAKREFASKLNEEDRAVRVGGEFAILSFKVFPEYQANKHLMEVPYFDIPRNWTRYLSVDPGRQICAVLFAAVPPPETGDFIYLYDELYIPNCDAELFGQAMHHKCLGQEFQAFLIDHQGARVIDTGGGRSIEDQYSEMLRKHRIACNVTGSQFIWGAPEPKPGIEEVRLWLRVRQDKSTKLRYFRDKIKNMIEEIKGYRYKRQRTAHGVIVLDDPEARGRVHQMANLRYLAMFRPRWIAPKTGKGPARGAILAFRSKKKRDTEGESLISLGPGGKKR